MHYDKVKNKDGTFCVDGPGLYGVWSENVQSLDKKTASTFVDLLNRVYGLGYKKAQENIKSTLGINNG